jgi:receptor protein-tyrosine kinase
MVGTVGLSTVLSGGVPLAEALQVSKFSNLTVLAAGVVPPNPSELLGSHAAENLFQMLREQFDYVIIDSPPVLAVTDANVVAGNSDGALVVVRFGTTKIDDIERSFHNVRSVGAEPLGAVLTMVPQRGFGSYGYGYGYGYGPDAHPEKGDSLRRPRHTSLSAPPEAT